MNKDYDLENFYSTQPEVSKILSDDKKPSKKREAKFHIGSPEDFKKSREILGNIITKDMKTSGGTDVDWLVEHKGSFIILEIKTFSDDRIKLRLGQIIAYENLHKQLNKHGKCYLYIVGVDENDFTDDYSSIWVFEMSEWFSKAIPQVAHDEAERGLNIRPKSGYVVERAYMTEITVEELRLRMESAWEEFEKSPHSLS